MSQVRRRQFLTAAAALLGAPRIARAQTQKRLPVELPSHYELVVNLGTAKALGLKVPQSILLRTDKVIE